jgi:hypothetical protein
MTKKQMEQVGSMWHGDWPFASLKYGDIKSYKPNPDDFVIGNGWVQRGGTTLLSAATGMGKSVLNEQIAVCVASGLPVFGMKVKGPCKVLVVEAENNINVLHEDIPSIVEQSGADEDLVNKNMDLLHVYGLNGTKFFAFLADALEHFKPTLLVVDPFQSFVCGNLNQSETMMEFASAMDDAIKSRDVALLLVTHFNKPKNDAPDLDHRELVYMSSGHAALSNWARTACELFPVKGDIRRFRLHFSKSAKLTGLKDAEGFPLRDVFIEHSMDAGRPYWGVSSDQTGGIVMASTRGPKADVDHKERLDQVRDIVLKYPKMSVRMLSRRLGFSKSDVNRLVEELEGEKKREKK